MIDGLSARTVSDIAHLERTRNYLEPGAVAAAVRLWKEHVRRPERQLWEDHEFGNTHWYCCGNPLEARVLLDRVLQALPTRSARELRRIVDRLDAAYGPPLPHEGTD